ncbi:MAG: hypothetical protein AAB885_02905 [Patescibacteria group bacterium]
MLKIGSVQKKILLLLALGLSLGFVYSYGQRRRTWRLFHKEWEKIDREALQKSINALYKSKLIDYKEKKDGTISIILNEEGKQKTLVYKLDDLKITVPKIWDKKWRLVCFDIPHRLKKAREALRFHLKRLGFYQFQKSLFIFPHECRDEIDFIIEIYNLRPFVRYIIANRIDNELHLKQRFHLP